MQFYDALKPLYLESDTSGMSLEAGLLQIRKGMNCGNAKAPDNIVLTQLHLPVKAYPVYSRSTVALNRKHLAYYMGSQNFTTIVLTRRYI